MNRSSPGADSITWLAVLFEGGLALLALAVGWLFSYSPIERIRLNAEDWWSVLLLGCAASLPLFLGLGVIERLPLRSLRHLRERATQVLKMLLGRCTVAELAVVSLFAGIGEEILFRGLMQDGLAVWIGSPWGIWIGLAIASILFGAVHAVTPTYAILAAIAGAYLGLLLIYTDNLLVPILAHAIYDFGALFYVLKWSSANESGENHQF